MIYRVSILIFLLVAAALPASAQDNSDQAGVPSDSEALLGKLRDWEFKERAQVEEQIAKKRQQTIDQLQRHLETYTKRGDLDSANAIQAEIRKLQQTELRPPADMTFEMPWEHEGKKGSVLVTFHPDGKATWENKIAEQTFDRGFRWSIESSGKVELWFQGKEKSRGMQWRFAENFASARVLDRKSDNNLDAIRIK